MAIIAICRGTKSYGTEMAECLAGKLDYPVIGEEVIRDAARELGVSVDKLEERLTARPTLWESLSDMRRTYLLAVKAALAERVVDGNLVYHGLTGGLLLDDLPATLTLRCIAPLDMRVRAVMRDSGMEWSEAERYIRDIDSARSRWVRALHDKDVCDPSLYDVVISLETLSVDAACGMVAAMLEQPEFERTDDFLQALWGYWTASKVMLALHQNEKLGGMELKATARQGRVTITGKAPVRASGKIGDRIAETARTVPGVEEVELKLEWFDPYP